MHEHNYDNCHNITCRRKCEKDGYNQAVYEFKNLINELVETLEEMRDANGSCSQEETCRFILNYIKQIGLLKE